MVALRSPCPLVSVYFAVSRDQWKLFVCSSCFSVVQIIVSIIYDCVRFQCNKFFALVFVQHKQWQSLSLPYQGDM